VGAGSVDRPGNELAVADAYRGVYPGQAPHRERSARLLRTNQILRGRIAKRSAHFPAASGQFPDADWKFPDQGNEFPVTFLREFREKVQLFRSLTRLSEVQSGSKTGEFPVISLLNRDFAVREWFAADWVIHTPVSKFSNLPENRSKSARVRAIYDYAWTRRTTVEALLSGMLQNLSALYFARSMEVRPNIASAPAVIPAVVIPAFAYLPRPPTRTLPRRCAARSIEDSTLALPAPLAL